jgi:ergothioneine biosynthesis protein EgtB
MNQPMAGGLRDGPADADTPDVSRGDLAERYRQVRAFTESLCQPLEPEDYVIQTMADASPTKWHLAHTSWFFETFILQSWSSGYRALNPKYSFLFNSYYNGAGLMHSRDRRGLLSRPTVKETFHYRKIVDREMLELLETAPHDRWRKLMPLVVLGLNHEQQHQELLLTDIKHAFAQNPLFPAYHKVIANPAAEPAPLRWVNYAEGVYWIGASAEGFAFDNERPRHREFVEGFQLASRPSTNGEYLEFIEDGGYRRPELWLSEGWSTVTANEWTAPLYWKNLDGQWLTFTLSGMKPVDLCEPVCHLSYFEADAFARWRAARLPTEAQWEAASTDLPPDGNFAEDQKFHPQACVRASPAAKAAQMFGDVWEWTGSSYSPYPGYEPLAGTLGEYNAKFMCNQYVLRGGSCATPRSHIRRTYRNFFAPDKRWQFSGVRLCRDSHDTSGTRPIRTR